MPRLSKQTAQKRSASRILEFLQQTGIDTSEINLPTETDEEQLLEAQAVVNYFVQRKEHGNRDVPGWIYETCKVCGDTFVYAYHYEGIKSCSIECMANQLRDIGIEWHYGRPQHLRWGSNFPAIVSAQALRQIEEVLEEA